MLLDIEDRASVLFLESPRIPCTTRASGEKKETVGSAPGLWASRPIDGAFRAAVQARPRGRVERERTPEKCTGSSLVPEASRWSASAGWLQRATLRQRRAATREAMARATARR